MKIVFLGTNGWYDTGTGNTLCTLIETESEFIILDAGNGFYKIDGYIREEKPVYLFLSHFHLDHVIGLHTLGKVDLSQGIDIFGPKGINNFFDSVINRPYTIPVRQLKTGIRINELGKGSRLPLDVEYRKLEHSSTCYGYRFTLTDKIISYCPDTGVCKNLFYLAKDSDLLIAECSYKSGMEDRNWPHLNPENAARVANESGAKKLALTHFDASLYLTSRDREIAESQAQRIFKNTFAAADGQEVIL